MHPSCPPLLEIIDLSISIKHHGRWKTLVRSLNFSISKGESLGIVGESGCGKSLTAQSIMRLLPQPDIKVSKGSILFNGKDILSANQDELTSIRGNDIAMIFQEPMTALNPVIAIGKQISEQINLHFPKHSKQERKKQVIELLNDVGIDFPEERYNSYPHQLSGGMRQRVMIAMALSCRPLLVIADEPTTALDVSLQQKILFLLKDLQNKYQTSLIFISHDLAVVAQLCQKALIMYDGEIIEHRVIEDLFTTPKHPYSKALLLCSPQKKTRPRSILPSIHQPENTLNSPEKKRKFFEEALKDFQYRSENNTICDSTYKAKSNQDAAATILSVKQLNKRYELKKSLLGFNNQYHQALNNISFSLFQGKTLGIVGTSGSGKSTLARIISGIEKADSGSVKFFQNTINYKNKLKLASNIQYIFQDPQESLNSRQTIKEILMEPLIIHKIGQTSEQLERAKESLLLVGLDEKMLSRYPHEFSGGQKQRIGIARALMLKPKLLICDEPVSALDVSVQAQILNLLNSLQKELNLTIIFITHDLYVVRHMADDIAVMNNGQIIEYGEALSICDHPQEKYTQQLIAATPTWPIAYNTIACDN